MLTELQELTLREIRPREIGNEITGKDVANAIGLKPRSSGKSGADMRSIINALRTKGYPICANGNGYYWPKDKLQLQQFMESFRARIRDQEKAVDGMTAFLDYEVKELLEI